MKKSVGFNTKRVEMEAFEASGLGLMVRLLRVWGFRVDRDPAFEPVINCRLCGLIIVIGLLNLCVAFPSMFFILVDNDVSLEGTSLSIMVIVIASGYLSTTFGYIIMVRVARHYSVLIRSLATAITLISDHTFRQKTVSRLRRALICALFPVAVNSLLILFIQIKGQFLVIHHNELTNVPHLIIKIVNLTSFGGSCIWLVTTSAFYNFTNYSLMVLAKVLVKLIKYNLPEGESASDVWVQGKSGQPSDVNRRLVLHQKMSRLVREAERVYSSFLLLSLCEELVVGVVYVKMMTMDGGRFSFAAHSHAYQLLLFVLKAYNCSNVNNKLKASLAMNQHPNSINDYDYCSTRQVNYIFYVSEQQVNRAELTYGGFFAVKKTFIFTVAGTILTYALVLTGMSDSAEPSITTISPQLLNNISNAL